VLAPLLQSLTGRSVLLPPHHHMCKQGITRCRPRACRYTCEVLRIHTAGLPVEPADLLPSAPNIDTTETTALPASSSNGNGDNLRLSQHSLPTRQRHLQVEEDNARLQHSSTRVTEATRRQPVLRASAGQSATTRNKKINIARRDAYPHNDNEVLTQAMPQHVKA
jgi:hypothetical protein